MLLNQNNKIISRLHTSSVYNNNRPEMKKIRKIISKERLNKCIICNKIYPLCLLDCAHLKPRSIIKISERRNLDNIEFMCKCCHFLYDNGYISIKRGHLEVSDDIIDYNLFDKNNEKIKIIEAYNQCNKEYFDYHYKYIYRLKK